MTEKYVSANFVRMLLKNLSFLTFTADALAPDIVPYPPLCHYLFRLGWIFLKLFTKTADMDVDRPDVSLVFVPPYDIE